MGGKERSEGAKDDGPGGVSLESGRSGFFVTFVAVLAMLRATERTELLLGVVGLFVGETFLEATLIFSSEWGCGCFGFDGEGMRRSSRGTSMSAMMLVRMQKKETAYSQRFP